VVAHSLQELRHLRWADDCLPMWDSWAGAVASGLAAATYWGHGRGRPSAACTEGSGGGSNSGATAGCSQQQQQQQQQQMQIRMQQAAFTLGTAAERLLLAGPLQEGSAPGLLMALAGHCCIHDEALQEYIQVLQYPQAGCTRRGSPCMTHATRVVRHIRRACAPLCSPIHHEYDRNLTCFPISV
jgi:hypothetical protein